MGRKNNVPAFTSVRFFWAISIVIHHIYLKYCDVVDFGVFSVLTRGSFGVTHFFILSGFLICMHWGGNIQFFLQ